MTTRRRLAAALAVTAAATAVAVTLGTGAHHSPAGPAAPGHRVILADAKERLPSGTAQDWVSYGDDTVVAKVTAETADTPSAEEQASGEGYVSRTVTLTVQQNLWDRSGAPALPATLTLTVDGWAFTGSTRTPLSTEGSRLEIGHTYLLTLARFASGEWAPIGGGARLPYDNNTVGNGEYEGTAVTPDSLKRIAAAGANSTNADPGSGADASADTAPATVLDKVVGQGGTSVAALLTGTAPDPVAQQNFALDPVARRAAVVGTTAPQDTYCSLAAPLDQSAGSVLTRPELGSLLQELAGKATGNAVGYATTLAAYDNGDTTVTATQAAAAQASLAADLNTACGLTVSLDPSPGPSPSPTSSPSPSPSPSPTGGGNTPPHTTG
ncbi:hypothetical protein [Streptomyces sp. TLI_171]|uniref:hypothetical protein n=1 Tax=Streptomyces sp. TLI_171 TaxID=1938859 RepID=UPI000C177E4B|nr:hypothetical protein [Streptomyces sp. TLI_171]RKE23542.1 hypothetical protein BX266_7016 [Streptomyces sp. TLI_171]